MSLTTITRIFCLVDSDVWTLLREIYNIQSCADPHTFRVSLKRILLTKTLAKVTIAHQYICPSVHQILKIWKVLKALYFTKLNQYKMSYLLVNRLLRFGERKVMLRNCRHQCFIVFLKWLIKIKLWTFWQSLITLSCNIRYFRIVCNKYSPCKSCFYTLICF